MKNKIILGLIAGLLLVGGFVLANSYTATVADTENVVGVQVNQNDVTFNQDAIDVVNWATSHGFHITQKGNASSSNSIGGSVLVDNTSNTGSAIVIYSKQPTPAPGANLISLWADDEGYNQTLFDSTHDGQGLSMSLVNNNPTAGYNLYLKNAAGCGGCYSIRMDAPVPQIEIVETDQIAPAGVFEIGVNGDLYYIAGRRADNTGFEKILDVTRLAVGGSLRPAVDNQVTLGQPSFGFSDIYLSTGSALNVTSGTFTITGADTIINDSPVRLKGYTISTLPTGTLGDTAFVSDAVLPKYLKPLIGGGTVATPVFYNGTEWVSY